MTITHAKLLAIGMFALLFVVGCGSGETNAERVSLRLVPPGGSPVQVRAELAADSQARARGLQGRKALPSGEGMLFVFSKTETQSFWMKDTLIPLDILFFDDAGRIVSLKSMEPCEKPLKPESQGTCLLYSSEKPIRFALEVPKGFINQHGITKQWTLTLGPWAKK